VISGKLFVKSISTRLFMAGCLVSATLSVPAFAADTRNMTIDQRLSRMERQMENQNLVEMFNRLQSLQSEIEQIRGSLEVLSHDIKGMKQRQKDLYLDLDNRIQQVEMAANSMAGSSMGDAGGSMAGFGGDAVAGTSTEGVTEGVPASEQEAYQRALGLLRDAKYKEAVEQFKVVLLTFPEGDYSDNAQYWMGEANYVMRDFNAAIEEFGKVISKYPSSSKIADAHLKIGFSYYELQDFTKAKASLERVVKDYPKTTAARLAQSRLHQMKLRGNI